MPTSSSISDYCRLWLGRSVHYQCLCDCVCTVYGPLCLYISRTLFCNCSECWGYICIHSELLGFERDAQLLFSSWLNLDYVFMGLYVFVCVFEKKCEHNRLLWKGNFTIVHSYWKNKAHQTDKSSCAIERGQKEWKMWSIFQKMVQCHIQDSEPECRAN